MKQQKIRKRFLEDQYNQIKRSLNKQELKNIPSEHKIPIYFDQNESIQQEKMYIQKLKSQRQKIQLLRDQFKRQQQYISNLNQIIIDLKKQNTELREKNNQLTCQNDQLTRELKKQSEIVNQSNYISPRKQIKQFQKEQMHLEQLSFSELCKQKQYIQQKYGFNLKNRFKDRLKQYQNIIADLKNLIKCKDNQIQILQQKNESIVLSKKISQLQIQNTKLNEQIKYNNLRYENISTEYNQTIAIINKDISFYKQEIQRKNYQIQFLQKQVQKFKEKKQNQQEIYQKRLEEKIIQNQKDKNLMMNQIELLKKNNKNLQIQIKQIQILAEKRQQQKQQYAKIFVDLIAQLKFYKKSLHKYDRNNIEYEKELQKIQKNLQFIQSLK